MKKQTKTKSHGDDTMRPEYDFSKGVRGKHAARYASGTNVVVLEPDVASEFPTAEEVNETLRPFQNCCSVEGVAPSDKQPSSRPARTALLTNRLATIATLMTHP